MIKYAIILLFTSFIFSCEKQEIDLSEITLEVNQQRSVTVDKVDYLIKIISIEDSRCPEDVICVWEGEVLVKISIDGTEGTLCLCEPRDRNIGSILKKDGIQIELIKVLPLNKANENDNSKTAYLSISVLGK